METKEEIVNGKDTIDVILLSEEKEEEYDYGIGIPIKRETKKIGYSVTKMYNVKIRSDYRFPIKNAKIYLKKNLVYCENSGKRGKYSIYEYSFSKYQLQDTLIFTAEKFESKEITFGELQSDNFRVFLKPIK